MSENLEKAAVKDAPVSNKPAKLSKKDKKDKAVKNEKKEKKPAKKPFSEMIHELKKVTWPTKEELRTYAICVIVFVVACTAFLALIDLGVGKFVTFLSGSGDKDLPKLISNLISK